MQELSRPLGVAAMIFACTFAGSLFGMLLHKKLPVHHLSEGSKNVVELVMGLMATMVALLLGLLIAAAQNTYDTQSNELEQVCATIVELDRLLVHYGPEASEARGRLHAAVSVASGKMWATDASRRTPAAVHIEMAAFFDAIGNLSPATEAQRFIQKKAFEISADIRQTRVLMVEQIGSSIPWPFLTVLVFWVSMLFLGFGLFAQNNGTVMAALFIGALSVSSAFFLILALNQPDKGLMRISDAPLRNALAQIGQ
jgi:hypothetical protein